MLGNMASMKVKRKITCIEEDEFDTKVKSEVKMITPMLFYKLIVTN
jgi:hypothetical protein